MDLSSVKQSVVKILEKDIQLSTRRLLRAQNQLPDASPFAVTRIRAKITTETEYCQERAADLLSLKNNTEN